MTTQDKDRIAELEQQNTERRKVLEDARNTVLWLEHRLPQGYGEVPHVKRTLAALDSALSATPADSQQAKDAERYRWLRQMIYDDRIIVAADQMLSGVKLDAAIDSVLSSSEGRKA